MGHCHQSVHCDLRFIGDAIYRDKKSAKNPTRLINDRGRAARPYWNFFPLIFGALHVNNNIIINYKDADAASNIKRGGGGGGRGGRFIVQCEFVPEGVCSPPVALNFLHSIRRPAATPLTNREQTLVSSCDNNNNKNFPVSTMKVKSKPLRILKIGVGLKLLVCQTTCIRKVHKRSLLWIH